MNEWDDPLEFELSSLRPQPISDDLQRRISKRLAVPLATSPRRAATSALICCLTMICLVVIVLRGNHGRISHPSPNHVASRIIPDKQAVEPTLLNYQRALAHSSDDLQTLLNERVVSMSTRNSAIVRVNVFTRSDSTIHALLGDE